MEDLDSLAGGVAYKHLMEPGVSQLTGSLSERGFYIVTASVDRFVLMRDSYLIPWLRHQQTRYAHHSHTQQRKGSSPQWSGNLYRQKLDGGGRKVGDIGSRQYRGHHHDW